MNHFDTAIEIEASPERVWATIRNIDHWSEWTRTDFPVYWIHIKSRMPRSEACLGNPGNFPVLILEHRYDSGCPGRCTRSWTHQHSAADSGIA